MGFGFAIIIPYISAEEREKIRKNGKKIKKVL